AAALHVTKHSYANFLLRAAPEHVSNQVANRTGARGGAPLDLELGPPLGGHDNTLGHAHDGEGLPAALAALDEVADILEFERDFGDEDDVGAAGDAGFERDPAGIAAHNFHHHDAVMRLSGGEELVNGLNTGVQRGIEAEGDIGGGEVVVNGLGNAYDVQPPLEEVEGNRLGAVAAHHDDSVNAERASIADKVHAAVNHNLLSVDHLLVHERIAAIGGAQDGAAAREDAANAFESQRATALGPDEAVEAVFDSEHSPAILENGAASRCADDGVQAG